VIRINLMPQKRPMRRRGEAPGADAGSGGESQAWLAFVLGAVLLEVIVLLFVYKTKQDQLTQVQKHNQELTANIDAIKREISNHAEIKTQLKELRDREDAIQKLQSARTGPTATMLELSRIMTPGRGPTVDRDKLEQLKRDNPSSVPNPNWDPRRLWLSCVAGLVRHWSPVHVLRLESLPTGLPSAMVIFGLKRMSSSGPFGSSSTFSSSRSM